MSDDEDFTEGDVKSVSGDSVSSDDEGIFYTDQNISAKDQERLRLQEQIEAFLASGGEIDRIPSNVVSDPPKKPESNYGGQPI